MPHHTLSVIIPTKNRPELLKRAMLSVAIQDYPGFEVCIVDNNSSQKTNGQTREIVGEFEKNYPAITWRYIHSNKKFASGARNDGMDASSGDHIIFLDDDDELLADSIKIRMNNMLADPCLALLYCGGYSKIYPYPFKIYRYYHYNKALHTERLLMMSCSSIMINKKIFAANHLRFDEEQSRMDDYDLCKMIIRLGLKVRSIPEPLVLIHLHPETRISSQKVINYDFKNALIRRWGPAEADTVFHYAEAVAIWRKCFGIEEQSFAEIKKALRNDFNRSPTLAFRLKFMIVSISPFLFLTLYHIALFISQSYKNRIAYSAERA
ncbi:glycosyltransferase family 2 protein [Mucilaginibacter ginsenosidivorans]|uniref:Glycosyltransferase family 2 protein n=1 Tax=Mucilaginibacter ginsenosidivorans TaxID=398053 RepID=A0A5B8UTJ4_9SPHI|nr:glycosyltransferase family A protein [Mucilaginibacter ginsenosidivorans]QEC62045.1 glycosyltransferase family 2 protein [Mucilaginibacter ginsenosidivorans]